MTIGLTTTPRRATRREWAGLAVLSLACLVYAMDLTVLHLAVPSITEDLQPSSTQLLWIIDIYGFMVAGFLITMGTLGDRIGRRKLLLIGAVLFSVTSLACALAPTAETLIAARALLGIAGATIGPSTLSLIFNMFRDDRQRAQAVGVWVAAFSAGGVVGPLIGGIALTYLWWGSVFLMAIPVMLLLLVLGPRILPEYRDPNARRLDILSAAMSLIALLAVIYGVKEFARGQFDAVSIGALLLGLLVGAAFLVRQTRLEDPLIDLSLFRIPSFSAPLFTYFVGIMAVFGYFLFVAQYLQLVAGLSPLAAGLWSLPSALGFTAGSLLASRVTSAFKPWLIVGTGFSLAALGLALQLLVQADGGVLIMVGAATLMSLAFGPIVTLATELAVGSAPPERAGVAAGISETAAELGGALGIAILGTIGIAIYRTSLAAGLPLATPPEVAAAAAETLGGAIAVAETLPPALGDAVVQAGRIAFVDGMHTVALIAAIAAFATGWIAAWLLRHEPIRSGQAPPH